MRRSWAWRRTSVVALLVAIAMAGSGVAGAQSPSPQPSPVTSPDPLGAFQRIPGSETTPSGLPWRPAVGAPVASDASNLANLTTWAGGFVAIDWSRDPGGADRALALWHSTDGQAWERSELPVRGDRIWSIQPFRQGLLLTNLVAAQRQFALAVWRSDDGIAWSRGGSVAATVPDQLGAGWRIGPTSLSAEAGRLSLIATISDSSGSGGFSSALALQGVRDLRDRLLGWTSEDGSTWVRRPVSGVLDADGYGSLDLVTSSPDGFVALRVGGEQAVIGSRQGLRWRDVASLPDHYRWGGNEGLLVTDDGLLLLSDSAEDGGTGCGNRLGAWRRGADGAWVEVLDRQPAFVHGAAASDATVILAGRSWCLGNDEWGWILVSRDGGRTWDPDLGWTGAVGTCVGDVAIRGDTAVLLACAPTRVAVADTMPSIWVADLPAPTTP